jgi:hypothetical protein
VHNDLEALRDQAALLGLALSDEDIIAIRTILRKTKQALAQAQPVTSPWGDAPCGFIPPGLLAGTETES